MSAHREVEVSCDGVPNWGCAFSTPFFAHTATRARREAQEAGWLVNQPGGKDYCPGHRAQRSAEGAHINEGDQP